MFEFQEHAIFTLEECGKLAFLFRHCVKHMNCFVNHTAMMEFIKLLIEITQDLIDCSLV